MMKLLVQLGLVISCAILFSGCSKEASVPAEAEKEATFDPLPQGLPVFVDIDEAFIADSQEGDGRSALFSYQLPENALDASEIKEIFSADRRLIVSLNTSADSLGSEVTLLVRNDSVYSINHESNQIRLLSHFTNTVCELIPRERVEPTVGVTTDKRLTVLHDELIYVMTMEGSEANVCTGDGKKRFYALPLDHQLDPTQDADGELSVLELVDESLARAKLMFAWEDANDPLQPGKQILTHGFLGYGAEEPNSTSKKPALVLYDDQREVIWRQERTIETFPVVQISAEKTSPAYLFDVQALENQYYLIQLGLDVFVVESTAALFSKAFNEAEDILSDRALKLSPGLQQPSSEDGEAIAYVVPAKAFFNEDDLLVVDGSKIFYLAYQTPPAVRDALESYEIIPQNPTDIASRTFADKRYFSQFDLESCAGNSFCVAAHDVVAQDWQFITQCDAALGCFLNDQVANFCETTEEKRVTQSGEPLCTASDYRHLSELNTSENDMAFKGFMQYADDFARSLDFVLENNRLYITARMHEKELLLRYNYGLDFSAPKLQREQVLFGRYESLFGLDTHFVANNLFLTALTESALRSNECYKNYKRVVCDLGELNEDGNANTCTGKDLANGLCTNKFQEYESRALFCTQAQLTDGSCSDENPGQIESLSVESSEEDAKWLKMTDYRATPPSASQMFLLLSNHQEALDAQVLDEGRLLDPQVWRVDRENGQISSPSSPPSPYGLVNGLVEQPVQGWIYKDAEPLMVEALVRFQLISEEIVSADTSGIKSELVDYLIEQSFADAESQVPDAFKVQTLGVSQFDRP